MDEEKKQIDPELEKFKPKPPAKYAIFSLLSSIIAVLCWAFRHVEFRQTITTGKTGQNWFMFDANVALRRGLLIFAIIALFTGYTAIVKRCKIFDIIAFIIAVIICLGVGWLVYQMGPQGFWLT